MMKKLNCVLLIDDDVPTNYYNKKVIEQIDCAEHVETCISAKAALEFLKSDFDDGAQPKPDLIFLDINMPGMDGWEFLDSYNELSDDVKGQIVIVMLSTSVNTDDEGKALQKGVEGFVRKPLFKDSLTRIIEENFG
ncbi:MAG: response regulator [Flavobacteriales bacterium]|nr:response regulator [Flavobacteriales bacterium]